MENICKGIAIVVTVMVALLSFMGHKIWANTNTITSEAKMSATTDHLIEMRFIERHEAIMEELGDMKVRVARIESSRFTAKDAQQLTEAILTKLPPQWLIDKVEENHKEIKALKAGKR